VFLSLFHMRKYIYQIFICSKMDTKASTTSVMIIDGNKLNCFLKMKKNKSLLYALRNERITDER